MVLQVPKEKGDAKMKKSIHPRISMFKRLKGKLVTKDQDKGLKASLTTKMKKKGRKGVNKHRRNSNKIRHHPSTLTRTSNRCQQKEKGSSRSRITKENYQRPCVSCL